MAQDTEGEEQVSPVKAAEARLVQLGNEKSRLEREIAVLQARYDKEQQNLKDYREQQQASLRADIDNVQRQLHENDLKEKKLVAAQVEVNQMRAQFEKEASAQKDLLLKRQVELDALIAENKSVQSDLAARLSETDKKKK